MTSPTATGTCPFHTAGGEKPVGPLPYYRDTLYAEQAAARAETPVYYVPDLDYWVVTKYEDCFRILNDHEHFNSVNVAERPVPLHPDAIKILQEGGFAPEPSQASLSAPRHTRIRNAMNSILNVKTFLPLEPQIRALTVEMLDRFEGRNRVDLLEELTYELPAHVIFLILGIPSKDVQAVKTWAGNRTVIDFSPSTTEQQIDGAKNLVAYWKYIKALVQDRLENPRDDFTSRLLEWRNGDDGILTLNEIATLTYSLSFAGHETTTNQLTNLIRELMHQRAAWDAICADPKQIPNVIEEGLRLDGSVIHWRRTVIKDTELSGVALPAGARLMMSFAAANRDPDQFPEPDLLDPARKNARKQLTFGHGMHVCHGAALARLEMKVVLEELTKRYPDMHLAADKPVDHLLSYVFRAATALWVDLGPKAG